MRRLLWHASGYLQIIRPHLFVLSIPSYLFEFFLIHGRAASAAEIARPMLVLWLIYSFGMVLNDWADWPADQVNFPRRPIPSGRVHPRVALPLSLGLAVLAIAGAASVGPRMQAVALITVLASSAHFGILKDRYRLVGLVEGMTSAISVLTFALFWAAFAPFDRRAGFLFATVFLLNFALDSVGAIRDLDGDAVRNYRSVAVAWGRSAGAYVAFGALLLAAPVAVLLARTSGLVLSAPLLVTVAAFGTACAGLLLYLIKYPTREVAYRLFVAFWVLIATAPGSLYLLGVRGLG